MRLQITLSLDTLDVIHLQRTVCLPMLPFECANYSIQPLHFSKLSALPAGTRAFGRDLALNAIFEYTCNTHRMAIQSRQISQAFEVLAVSLSTASACKPCVQQKRRSMTHFKGQHHGSFKMWIERFATQTR